MKEKKTLICKSTFLKTSSNINLEPPIGARIAYTDIKEEKIS